MNKDFNYFLEKAKAITDKTEKLDATDLALFGSYFYSVGYKDGYAEYKYSGIDPTDVL